MHLFLYLFAVLPSAASKDLPSKVLDSIPLWNNALVHECFPCVTCKTGKTCMKASYMRDDSRL